MVGRTQARAGMRQSQQQSRHDFPEIVVFTGDLIGSSRLSPEDLSDALRALGAASREIGRTRGSPDVPPAWEPRFSAFRGDGWQCVAPDPAFALRAALILRARLAMLGRPFDTRISVGIGSGWLAEEPSLNLASGPAFELSGHGLDDMKAPRRFAVAWEAPPPDAPLIRAVYSLADEISRKWTPKQAEVLAHSLQERTPPNQETLARLLGRTQQTIAEHLSGGGAWALQDALRSLEQP